ncbi:Peptide chain release factor 2 [Tetrabaena socialis]|uniref:Peptide chain release factor 2 n=1 Tax=Tetrabaena socialis TaxID=47790 RepID=A0A2J8A372_9CHLO|nr:Peptide chain release factor 2 [Tetrabaena socialis]|eukprot:PNH06956.1 Peptide chain release factor 2 [Tetrabaena socialis]
MSFAKLGAAAQRCCGLGAAARQHPSPTAMQAPAAPSSRCADAPSTSAPAQPLHHAGGRRGLRLAVNSCRAAVEAAPGWLACRLSVRRRTGGRLTPLMSAAAASELGPVSGPPPPPGASEVEGLGALRRKVAETSGRLDSVLGVADLAGCRAKLASLEHDASGDGLWGDAARAQALLSEINALRSETQELERFRSLLDESVFAVELIEAEEGASSSGSGGGGGGFSPEQVAMAAEALATLRLLNQGLDGWELRRLLSGAYDERGARVVISAGAGGVDAMDWAEMLERMYLRWAEQRGYVVRTVDRAPGDEAGLKSVELEVAGRHAYGYLRGEKGTHRLVRNSPFNSKGLRQTSFAGVDVMPLLGAEDLPDLELNEKDLEITTMRSGGKGGQNVNKVESGVRIVHTPTGLAVKCTQERSQLQNKAIALDILKARLLVVLEEQNTRKVAEIRGDLVKAEWGQQIRNYVFHPYKLVKDTRTGYETSDVQAVMDGELNELMASVLRQRGRQATGESLAGAA